MKLTLSICLVLLLATQGWAEENLETEEQLGEAINNIDISPESAESTRLGCDDVKCNRKCKDKGKKNGQCILGRCKCDIKKSQDEVINIVNLSSESAESTRLGCDDVKCNRKCKDKGKKNGQCILGRCKCDIKKSQDEIVVVADAISSESAESTRLGCDDAKCNKKCKDKGKKNGQCILGRCKCDIKKTQDEVVVVADDILPESAESARLGCDDFKCDKKCKDKGKKNGQCILGRCKCDIKRSQEESMPEFL